MSRQRLTIGTFGDIGYLASPNGRSTARPIPRLGWQESSRAGDRRYPKASGAGVESDAPLVGGVGVKRPGDVRRSFAVELDRSILASVLGLATDVEIAGRRPPRCPTLEGLLLNALHDFLCEVSRVELRDRRHDPVQETPFGVVSMPSALETRRAGSTNRLGDRDVVGLRPSEAITWRE